MAVLVSGTYSLNINYSCSFATGSCQFSLIPLPFSAAGPSSSVFPSASSPSAQPAIPPSSPSSPSQNDSVPSSPGLPAPGLAAQNLSTPAFVSAPSHVFEEPCPYAKNIISNASGGRAIVSFELLDPGNGRPLDSMRIGLVPEGGNLTPSYSPESEFALVPNRAYDAVIGDNSSRYYVTYRNFSVDAGTMLTIRLCPRLLTNPEPAPAVSQHDFLLLQIGNYSLPSPDNSGALSRQPAVRVSSSIPGAFTFREGRSSEFYILPSGQYFAPLSNRSAPAPASGFPYYADGRVSGFFIGYLNGTAWAPSRFIDSGRLLVPDALDGQSIGQIVIDTDYSRFHCRDCANSSNRSLEWVQLFGHASPMRAVLSNVISPGFSTPSGLLYNYYSPERIEFLVPLYAAKPPPPPRPSINVTGRPMRGSSNATLTIAEFGDFACPFTKAAEPLMQKALQDYGGRINETFLPYLVNPFSKQAASASECAADQGKFWEYHESVFADLNLDDASLKAKAQALGLDMDAFRLCFATQEKYPLLDAMQAEGNSLGVYATPTFFINGRKLVGMRPYDDFKQVIEEELAASNSSVTNG